MGSACCKEEEIDFEAEVELSHFHLLRSVGKGAFGKVRVVQHKHSKVLYALKYINKAKCIKMRAVENIVQERRLLEEIDYPLVCNLRYAFQDDENLFMVLDLMLGGDLRFHLERQGQMKEEVVKFYVAQVSLGLDYLHSRKIIHRDLKPDNVLLDEKGHAHLTDFNIAVHFSEKKPLTSVAGSMAYMAPEVLMKKGYLDSVDWWSLGIVMYELLFSKRPFRGKTNSALTQAILHEPLQFPENVNELISDECLDCLQRFCERDISKRLGCGPNGINDIKAHPWFNEIEWDRLDTKQAKAPFIPDSKRANFDATHELEELLLEDNPLKAKKRANPNQDLSELSKEMRMMEEKFLIYDFTKMRRRSHFMRSTMMNDSLERRGSKRRKSEGRSSGSLTAVERGPSAASSPINMDFDNDANNMTILPTPPPSAKILPSRHDYEAIAIENNDDNLMEKNKGEWCNERPASQNRERSPLPSSGLAANGRSSTPIISNDSDYLLMKSYPSGGVSPPSSIAPSISDSLKRAPLTLFQITQTSLTPPPRIQSPVLLAQATISSPSSIPPGSPIPQPSHGVGQPSRLTPRNMPSVSSLRSLSKLSSPTTDIVPSPFPPPTFPLPPTPTSVSQNNYPNDILPSSSSIQSNSSSMTRVHTLSPPATNKRPPILIDQPITPTSSHNKHFWSAGDFGENTHHSSTSGNSIGSRLSSEVSVGISRSSGHFRTASDVSNGSGALSAVGVPAGF